MLLLLVGWGLVKSCEAPRAGEMALRASCGYNLRQIHLALTAYDEEHSRPPADLKVLVDEGLLDADYLHCPAARRAGAEGAYRYHPEGWSDPETPVVTEAAENHQLWRRRHRIAAMFGDLPPRRHALYADGRVERLTGAGR